MARLTQRAAVITAAVVAITCVACSSPSSSSGPGTGSGPQSGPAAELVKYAQCMRSHGITDYPDPSGAGNSISIGSSAQAGSGGGNNSDLNPDSPAYQAASQACRSLAPGGSVSAGQLVQDVAAGVKLATCMRAHGFPSFPDPTSQNIFNIPSSIDMNSSEYESAISTCQSKAIDRGARFSQNLGGPGDHQDLRADGRLDERPAEVPHQP
jgi:hypothetical protein